MFSEPGLIDPDSTGISTWGPWTKGSSRWERRLLAETSPGARHRLDPPVRGAVSAGGALERLRRQDAEQENRQPEGILFHL